MISRMLLVLLMQGLVFERRYLHPKDARAMRRGLDNQVMSGVIMDLQQD